MLYAEKKKFDVLIINSTTPDCYVISWLSHFSYKRSRISVLFTNGSYWFYSSSVQFFIAVCCIALISRLSMLFKIYSNYDHIVIAYINIFSVQYMWMINRLNVSERRFNIIMALLYS